MFESLKIYKLVCLYFSIVFLNSLIYRYIAIVYVYRYVWKQNKLKNGKPVRKRIAFVTLPFFLNLYLSLCSLLLSFSRYFVCWFVWLILVLLISNILVSLYLGFCFSMFFIIRIAAWFSLYCWDFVKNFLNVWKYVFCEAVYF